MPQNELRHLPQEFIHCPRDDLIILISRMLNSLIEINDNYNGASSIESISPNDLTRFHSRTPPGISVHNYLARLSRYCSLENAVLLASVYYIDLLSTVYSPFTLNSLTVHRFLLTATTVGSKGLCDSFCTNTHYAKVGGVQVNELDILEREFLIKVNYRILPRDSNIENCLNDQKVLISKERKKSINTLEVDKNFSTLDADSDDTSNSSEIKPSEQHLLKDGGYNILDLYYKKMIILVGEAVNRDDNSITQSIHYVIDDIPSPITINNNLIKTEPDTLDDESYNKMIIKFLKAYNGEAKQFKKSKLDIKSPELNGNTQDSVKSIIEGKNTD